MNLSVFRFRIFLSPCSVICPSSFLSKLFPTPWFTLIISVLFICFIRPHPPLSPFSSLFSFSRRVSALVTLDSPDRALPYCMLDEVGHCLSERAADDLTSRQESLRSCPAPHRSTQLCATSGAAPPGSTRARRRAPRNLSDSAGRRVARYTTSFGNSVVAVRPARIISCHDEGVSRLIGSARRSAAMAPLSKPICQQCVVAGQTVLERQRGTAASTAGNCWER